MKTTQSGRLAEEAVAQYLSKQGLKIIAKNWRTRVCEIDIIAAGSNIIYFVEVKYRRQDAQGDGLTYITQKKITQMKFAAEIWIQQNNWAGDYRLLAASVDRHNYRIVEVVEVD